MFARAAGAGVVKNTVQDINRGRYCRGGSVITAHSILYVTQIPVPDDPMTVVTTFGNHRGETRTSGRGGDLWIRYPDGTQKNLTQAAGYGSGSGFQGATSIAVRDPSIYWDGRSML